MGTHAGSEGKVFIGTDQVAEVKSWSMEVTSDTVDASIIGTQWRKNQATIKGWSGSFDAFWDETDTEGQGALAAGATVTLNLYPEGDATGAMTSVADANLLGTEQLAARLGNAALTSGVTINVAKRIGYVGKKRYVTCDMVKTGTTSVGCMSVTALLFNPANAPISNP